MHFPGERDSREHIWITLRKLLEDVGVDLGPWNMSCDLVEVRMRREQFMGKGVEGDQRHRVGDAVPVMFHEPFRRKRPTRTEYRIRGPLQVSEQAADHHLTLHMDPPSLWLPSCHQAASKNPLSAHNGRGRLQTGCRE